MRGGDNGLWQLSYNNGAWGTWTSVGCITPSPRVRNARPATHPSYPIRRQAVWVNGTLKTTDGTPIADAESTAESALRQIIQVLQQVMRTHDAEKLAISVLEIYADS